MRDQIHSEDVARAMDAFIQAPRSGEVYNMGGGRESNASLLECIQKIEERIGRKVHTKYLNDNRIGDHICYISDTTKLKLHYPHWRLTKAVDDIIDEMVESELRKQERGTYGENLT